MNSKVAYKPEETQLGLHPFIPVMWVLIVSISMMFAAFTSAYLVRRGDGNWLLFDLPQLFFWSSLVIIVSSVFMQGAYFFTTKDEIQKLKLSLIVTFGLGCVFLVLQWLGWESLMAQNIHFGTQVLADGSLFEANPAGSFVYVISGMHATHIIAGLIFLIVAYVRTAQYKVHSKNKITILLCTIFWHFLGALWLYLFGFMFLFR